MPGIVGVGRAYPSEETRGPNRETIQRWLEMSRGKEEKR